MPIDISLAIFFVAIGKKQSIHSFWKVGKGAHIDFIDKANLNNLALIGLNELKVTIIRQ
jgi:hypothetical protein